MARAKLLTDKHGEVRPLTKADQADMVSINGLPDTVQAVLRSRGRPVADTTKERVTIRLSPEVVQQFRATGPGWQTRLNAALTDWLRTHSPQDAAI